MLDFIFTILISEMKYSITFYKLSGNLKFTHSFKNNSYIFFIMLEKGSILCVDDSDINNRKPRQVLRTSQFPEEHSRHSALDGHQRPGEGELVDTSRPRQRRVLLDTSRPRQRRVLLDNSRPRHRLILLDTSWPWHRRVLLDTSRPRQRRVLLVTSRPRQRRVLLDNSRPRQRRVLLDASWPGHRRVLLDT